MKKSNEVKILIGIIIILIIIIIFLLIHGCENGTEVTKPQGNIEIFEIKCDVNCECGNGIEVSDQNIKWENKTDLKIFEDSMYVVKGKVAPESSNIYQYVVKNTTNYNIKYDMEFEENNAYGINMKYRLKKNDNYVVGNENNWVTASEINQYGIYLSELSSDTYYLEWKWFSSANDNSIGSNINSKYGLGISIKAVQVNE